MQEAVGAAIRTRREARGWTQEQLGRHAKLDKGTISRIERGANVSIDTLLMITRALNATLVVTVEDAGSKTVTRDGATGTGVVTPGADTPLSNTDPSVGARLEGHPMFDTETKRYLAYLIAGLRPEDAEALYDEVQAWQARRYSERARARERKAEGD